MYYELNLSYSKIGRFKRCRRKYWWNDVEKVRPKERPAAPRIGTMGHAALAAFFQDEDWEQAINDCWKKETGNFPLAEYDASEKDLIKEVVRKWIDDFEYFRDPAEEVFLPPEYKFETKIMAPSGYPTHTKLIGCFDLVIKVPREGLWLVDHKFTKNKMETLMEGLELDEQLDYYLWALSQLFPEERIMGAIYNGIRMKLPKEPELLKDGTRLSKAKIETDYDTYLSTIKKHRLDPFDYTEMLTFLKMQPPLFAGREWTERNEAELERIGEELYWISREVRETKHPTRTRSAGKCSWDCAYKNLCIAEWKGGDVQPIIEEYFEIKKEKEGEEDEEETEERNELPW